VTVSSEAFPDDAGTLKAISSSQANSCSVQGVVRPGDCLVTERRTEAAPARVFVITRPASSTISAIQQITLGDPEGTTSF
jgi:hypothetical protein